MAMWTGLGNNTELFWAVLSQRYATQIDNIVLFVELLKMIHISSFSAICLNRYGLLRIYLLSPIILIMLPMEFNIYYLTCFLPIPLSTGTEAARGAEGAPAPPTVCVIKELFFSLL
jgi:hypothetical protein